MGLLRHCFNCAFLRKFAGLLFKEENTEDKNKVVVVGLRFQEKEFSGFRGVLR